MKNAFLKKLAAIMICLLLVASMVPITASAEVGTTFTNNGITYKVLTETRVTGGYSPFYYSGTVAVTGATIPDDGTLTIPTSVQYRNALNQLGLYQVVEIEAEAFGMEQDLKSLDLSAATRLTAIGDSAFASCTYLEEISFPSSLVSIGATAFANCNALEEIYIDAPELASIGAAAFGGQTSLTKATILSDVDNITVAADAFGIATNAAYTVYTNQYNVDYVAGNSYYTVVNVIKLDNYRFRNSYVTTANDTVYNGKAFSFSVNMMLENEEGTAANKLAASDYTVSYLRYEASTTDLTSAGEIEIRVEGVADNGYIGTRSFFVDIRPAALVIIARDKNVPNDESVVGTADDVIYYGLASQQVLHSVTLTASDDVLTPSAAVIKHGNLDVTENYDIVYVDGRSFTEKSIESFVKTTEGNVDTYTITFGDGTTETIVITNGVDGEDGTNGVDGKDGATGANGSDGAAGSNGASVLVYASMGLGGVSLAGVIALLIMILKKKRI